MLARKRIRLVANIHVKRIAETAEFLPRDGACLPVPILPINAEFPASHGLETTIRFAELRFGKAAYEHGVLLVRSPLYAIPRLQN